MLLSNRSTIYAALSCTLGFIINFVAFYPGFMTPDSFQQYSQSITGNYNDWHPPAMAFVWHILNHIVQGPQVMLALQLLMLWAACYNIMLLYKYRWWMTIIYMLFFLFPVIQNFSGYVIKDTHMAFSWLLASSMLLHLALSDKKSYSARSILILLLLAYGAWVRPNALPGVLPLLALFAIVTTEKTSRRVVVFICASAFIITGQIAIPKLLHAEKQYPENKIFLHDLTGIFVKTNTNVFPAILYSNKGFDTAYLRTKYHPATFDDIWWNSDGKTLLPDTSEEIKTTLKNAWKDAIIHNSRIYLQNRWEGFLYYLRLKKRSDFYCNYYMNMYPDPNEFGLKVNSNNVFYKLYNSMLERQKDYFYMNAWFWFFTNFLLLLFIPIVHRQLRWCYLSLVASGIFYKLPDFFVFQTDTDFRYFYWNSIACILAILVLVYSKRFKNNI